VTDLDPVLAKAAVDLLQGTADKAGVPLDVGAAVALAQKLAQVAAELVDGHAKRTAHQAGLDAAAGITTLEEAEASAKKR
jgi:hypothetical protein